MKRARMATGLFTSKLAVLETPSRFVVEKDCTWATPVAPKNDGNAVMENCGVAAEDVAAVKRVQRRVTVSTWEEARVFPAAAVKDVT